ncbi:hypothetical protein GIB67_042990 [Kingdonia uniflora]|uniref:Uncharacterized protein n=1 Tax=Kingdonia uniflora TaxID=39325 RepID=A0A7J7NTC7_9MAGN|nr:hypothetical protein GIB67_042990 [Kingdonia uniflora]
MKIPRSNVACCIVGGKVYVGGGCTSSSSRGIDLAEVYDPVKDRYGYKFEHDISMTIKAYDGGAVENDFLQCFGYCT